MRNENENSKGSIFLRVATVLLGVMILLVALFLGIYFGCEMKKVHIKGNELHDDQVVKDVILNDEYSWNTVYVFLKYKIKKPESIPFIDTMEIFINSPSEITIQVYEKDMIGYLYIETTGQYAYIDKDGVVEELSARVIDDIAMIKGLNVSDVELYKPLKVENKGMFKKLLSLTHTLQKYHLMPQIVEISKGNQFLLHYDGIMVNFGKATDLNEKTARMQQIFPQLEGLSGTLHLEEWVNETSDIIFEKN